MLAMLVYQRVNKYGYKKSTFSAATIGSVEKHAIAHKNRSVFQKQATVRYNHDGCILNDGYQLTFFFDEKESHAELMWIKISCNIDLENPS